MTTLKYKFDCTSCEIVEDITIQANEHQLTLGTTDISIKCTCGHIHKIDLYQLTDFENDQEIKINLANGNEFEFIPKKNITNAVEHSVAKFLYYDRKEDEDLPRGQIEKAIKNGTITVDEIVETFKKALFEGLEE